MQGLIGLISTDWVYRFTSTASSFWQVTQKNCLLHSQTPGDSAGLSVFVWVWFFYAQASALDRGTPGPLVASSAPSCQRQISSLPTLWHTHPRYLRVAEAYIDVFDSLMDFDGRIEVDATGATGRQEKSSAKECLQMLVAREGEMIEL